MSRILCVCERGNSRSVALAYLLKDQLNQDAIAIGIRANSDDTKEMLYEWADYIVLVDKTFVNAIPSAYQSKLIVWDVGPDRYFLGFHPELLRQYREFIEKHITRRTA